jgi:hypothetical protein
MAIQIQFRRGTAAQWASANTTLTQGELGLEIDTSYFKIGDGNTAWTNLGYAISQLANNATHANNSAYLGGLIATGYQTTAGLAANVVTLEANSATYLGGNTAATLRTYTDDRAANAYSNSVSYVETQISGKIANSITANSATAYTNAVNIAAADASAKVGGVISYVGVVIGTANTAMVANAEAAYTNSTIFASNATNINTGTLSETRLPYRMNQNVRTTDNVTFNDMAITGNLTVTGNTTIVGANNLVVKDSVISLHTQANLAAWTSNDGKLVGVAYHYYDTQDRQALLAMNPSNTFLTYYKTSTDAAIADPTGTDLGTIQADTFYAGNSTVYSTVNATVYSGTANNASYLNGNSAATLISLSSTSYTNAVSYTDTKIGLVNTAITANSSAAYSNAVLYVDNKLYVNSAQLSSNLSSYQTTAGLSANVATLTSNSASFIGTLPAVNVVSNSQLSSNLANYVTTTNLTNNLANYQTTAGLSSNVATLTSNSASFVGAVSAANVVSNAQLVANLANYATTTAATAYAATAYSNAVSYVDAKPYVNTSQLSSNLANYQTTAGLSANVATLTSNSTSFVGAVSAANVVSNTQLSSNLANYQTTAGLAANVATLTANNSSFIGAISAVNVVSNSQLSSNLSGYASLSGATFTGAVQISNNLTVSGNITFSGNSVSVGANSLVIQDAVISLHTNSSLGALSSNDGKLIGIEYHYYDTSDKHALLAINQSNAFLSYYKTATDAAIGDPTGILLGTIQADTFYAGNSTVYTTTNSTIYTGTSNNTLYVGTVSAANVVSNAQLAANLANFASSGSLSGYQTTAGLAANVATLTSNSTNFVGTVSAANVVSNSQLSSNLANYQTTAGLSANVATLASNNALYLGGVAAASYVNTTGSYSITGVHTYNANIVISTLAGISTNGTFGTSGQVLTTNGSVVYWAPTGAGSFTNGQSISVNNFVISGVITANSSNGTAGQVLTSNSTGVYWDAPAVSITAANATSQSFTGDNTTAIFTLTNSVANQRNVIVSINGLLQVPVTHYTISGTTLTFTDAPYTGAVIEARSIEGVALVSGGSGGTISSGDLFIGSMLLGGM